MTNRLKAYTRRTILTAAKEYAYPKARRTPESTRSALQDATRGTDTGWWSDLIYTAPMLEMAHKYRPRVADELHEGGLKVLRNRRYAKRLEPFAASIAALDHFRLVGFEDISRRGDGTHNVPVYAAWSTIPPKGDALDGGTYEAFRFRNVPWQSGGDGPEIVE